MHTRSRWLLLMVASVLACGSAAWANPEGGGGAAHVFVPAAFGWVHTVLLGIVWLFVAAVVAGPVVLFFQPPPPPEAADHHDAHDSHEAHAASDARAAETTHH